MKTYQKLWCVIIAFAPIYYLISKFLFSKFGFETRELLFMNGVPLFAVFVASYFLFNDKKL